ncbi:hypothetical protein Poly51_59900 [Rubripirellula tenax]|uniref:Uncharacterized protein n=1 Tax=Rubripirellula tenax TaxID=2528015 RepID=A0A5C6EAC7_9BACT|nr:hypothetical protein [Rubripirellula tenax]TWU44721.1 hypothetical protein Poly51_59900 [Rubripirellula tenax]
MNRSRGAVVFDNGKSIAATRLSRSFCYEMKAYILLSTIALTLSVNACAEAPARMRYEVAIQAADLVLTDIGGVKSQSICLSTRSRLADVSPTDIKIILQTKAGDIPIPLDADGKFTLPVIDALRKENPWITANQPQGSLIMKASVNLQMRVSSGFHNGSWRVRYSSLFPLHTVLKRVDAVTDAISKDHEVKSNFPVPKGVVLSCADELAHARMVIGDDEREIPSRTKGDFLVPFNADLMALDVWIAVQPARGWTVTPAFEPVNTNAEKAEQ